MTCNSFQESDVNIYVLALNNLSFYLPYCHTFLELVFCFACYVFFLQCWLNLFLYNGKYILQNWMDPLLSPFFFSDWQRFPTEDHLMIHRHKHEMTLKFPSIKTDNMLSGKEPSGKEALGGHISHLWDAYSTWWDDLHWQIQHFENIHFQGIAEA